jgi:hypothetical protein
MAVVRSPGGIHSLGRWATPGIRSRRRAPLGYEQAGPRLRRGPAGWLQDHGEGVTELTWPLLLAYMHPAEATARWARIINADGSRVVIVLRPVSVTGREQVK